MILSKMSQLIMTCSLIKRLKSRFLFFTEDCDLGCVNKNVTICASPSAPDLISDLSPSTSLSYTVLFAQVNNISQHTTDTQGGWIFVISFNFFNWNSFFFKKWLFSCYNFLRKGDDDLWFRRIPQTQWYPQYKNSCFNDNYFIPASFIKYGFILSTFNK